MDIGPEVLAALRGLPARERAVHVLRDVLGWRPLDVADLLQIPINEVSDVRSAPRSMSVAVANGLHHRPDELTPEERPMNEPTTTIDPRFSDPDAAPTSWDDALRAIETAELFWIITVRADGRPHVTPLVAVWLDGALHFCTGAEEQKAVNLRANPHVVLMTGCNDWDQGLDVVVEGDAVQVTDDRTLKELASAWRNKWDGRWHFEASGGVFHHERGDGTALVFSVTPAKVLAFGKGTFTHTRHRF